MPLGGHSIPCALRLHQGGAGLNARIVMSSSGTSTDRAFKDVGAVTTIVTKHVLGSGIQRDSYRGAHLLRHTFATLLVNRGVSIKGISDMLGHASIDTTSIYGKVDLSSLRTLARPMPDCQWRP